MPTLTPAIALDKFTTFGDLLKYLRRRVGLTQRELSIAVGYSDAQISRLEQNQRLPDPATIEARFISSLDLEQEPKIVARLMELAAEVRREDAPALGLPPFKGLLYFDESDADLFFGREALTARLMERLAAGVEAGERFLAVVGASGSGKSSVVRAGLVPALRWRSPSASWPIHVLTPAARPLETLAAGLTHEVESVTATATLADDLARDPRSLHLFVRRAMPAREASHVLLVVDQFEELFTLCRSQAERNAFVNNLLSAAFETDGPTIVVIALRADFYAHCADFAGLRRALARHQEYIGPMTPEEMCQAIEEPARRGHWEFEPGLVDLLLHDVGDEPGALPLLSHALLETWQRRRGRTLTLSGYLASGGVRSAIAETAEAVFKDQLDQGQRAIARQIFLRLTELGEGTQDTRRRAALTELVPNPQLQPSVESVLKTLADARLITTSEDVAEVAHEALIREWPTLREWLAEDREGLRLHRHLTEAAQEWDGLNRDSGVLFRGARLAQVIEWAKTHRDELNALEREFLAASEEWAEREAAEREAQRQRELELQRQRAEEQAQAAHQLRKRAWLLTGALIVAGALAVAAVVFGQRANQEARLATSRELAAAAISNLAVDPERSILLALRAVSVTYTLEAEDALHRAVQASRVQLTLRGHTAQIWRIAFSPDGMRFATASQDGTAKVWDATTGQELLSFSGHTEGGVNTTAFSPDGTRLVSGGDDRTARVWDAATGQELLNFSGHADLVMGVAFNPDGTRLATASGDKTAIVWNAATGQKLLTLRGHTDWILNVAFSPNGSRLATSSYDGNVKVWDTVTGKELLTVAGVFVAFSPDGMRLATISEDPTVKVWDAATGQELLTLRGHTNVVTSVAFSPDGTRLATTSGDRKAIVWDAATGQALFTLAGHNDWVEGVAFSPDGMRLVTASGDGTMRMWSLAPSHEVLTMFHPPLLTSWFALSPDGMRIVMMGDSDTLPEMWRLSQETDSAGSIESPQAMFTLNGHTDYVRGLAFSPDGTRVATTSFDGTAKVWDAATGRELFTLTGHTGEVFYAVFSPDGTRLATASGDHTAKVWDAITGEELFTLTEHTAGVVIVTFSPDGTRIATGDGDGNAKVWDAATGRELLTMSHDETVYGVAFSPDGRRLATSTSAGTAHVWDAVSGEELLTFAGHTSAVVTIHFSPDGTRLATASRDGTAKVWDAATGEELLTLYGSGVGICCLAFSLDGTRLFTGGDDGVRVYALRSEDLVTLAKSRVTRSLTTEECQRYLHVQECP